jgi:hypothetical protein
MDLWDKGGNKSFKWMESGRAGNDMRGLPTGDQLFKNIHFNVIDPDKNNRRAVIAVSTLNGFPRTMEVPVNDTASAIYLLHSSSDNIPSNVAGAITLAYADGSETSQYIMKGKDVTNWWFSDLNNEKAGVAWSGPNPVSAKVGVCWAAMDNPNPRKKIEKLIFHAPLEGGIYAVIGISLSDRPHYIKPKAESFGGPDNWAAANGMAALVEGLAGAGNEGLAFNKVRLSPRWSSADVDSVGVTIRFAASDGYIAYRYKIDHNIKKIEIILTGSGDEIKCHVLLPKETTVISKILLNEKEINYSISRIKNSQYADFDITMPGAHKVMIDYN